jgi:transglutaminase-like putative cysteine protease
VDLFLNDVLPYRSVDEPLDQQDWRPMFFAKFMPLVAEAESLTEAAQILNREIWALWDLRFVPDQTPEIMSVGQVLANGFASCTGLSIFLVNACRAVGIPARVAGK